MKRLKELGEIEGVYLEAKSLRIYPHERVDPVAIGYVDVDNRGLAGIEYAFCDLLDTYLA